MRPRMAVRRPSLKLAVELESVVNLVAAVVKYVALAFLFPAFLALGFGEPAWPFFAAAGITFAAGFGVELLTTGKERVGVREGFLVVALMWLVLPAVGAIPYFLAGEGQLARPLSAFFESVSGFTATGATILGDVDFLQLNKSMAMWRQFTQWLGGMGILMLAIVVLPRLSVGGRQLLHSELAGPTELERLTSSIRETARQLWLFYVGLTALAVLVLSVVGWSGLDPAMDVYDAAAHAFTTVALGGFSTEPGSLAAFGPATQWAVIAFVLLAGMNFLRLYRAFVQRRPLQAARDEEIRLYLILLAVGSGLLFIELSVSGILSGEEAVRHAVFEAVSTMTTAGYASADYTVWGGLAALTLLVLMFIGASAGSTGGSLKVVRHLLTGRVLGRELVRAVHREAVLPVRLSGAPVDERILRSVAAFVVLYLVVFALGSIGLVVESRRGGIDVTAFEAIGAAGATLGNVGPAFGFAGPFGSYAPFSDISKGILIGLMWLGRLEIIPVLVLLTRSYWRN